MKKASKKNKVNKKLVPLIVIFIVLLVLSAVFLLYVYTQNYINVEYIDKSSSNVKSDEVTSVSPIIINNVVVGGVSDKGMWLSKNNLFGKANISKNTELDLYSINGKMGSYTVHSVNVDSENNMTYVVPLKDLSDSEYLAVNKNEKNIMMRKLTKVEQTKKDEKYVKKALGKYKLLNNTVKINEVYEAYLGTDQITRIISATSNGKNRFGVYSVVVAVKGDECDIIKYSYVKNTKSSINWPVYSIKFVCDLNNDDSYELILQEMRETTMKYSILEFKKNKYYEVIGFSFKI